MTTEHPLRLALLLANLRPGGAEKQMLMLAKGLPAQGIEVDLLSLVGEGPLDDAARAAGVTIHHLGKRPLGACGQSGARAR